MDALIKQLFKFNPPPRISRNSPLKYLNGLSKLLERLHQVLQAQFKRFNQSNVPKSHPTSREWAMRGHVENDRPEERVTE
ncbi:hypothetical protein PUN28_015560 [Cardiocondyla obscurior]|uniref:Uncharacterized protein n=1 Tax=Cardiocondyla obscurior TaxID=286306 RepID=A0AAW2EVC6_9HYME